MRVSLKWLGDYVDLTLPIEELAHRLTMAGTEVGEIIHIGGGWDNILVGEVVAVEKHPNADRLKLATVNLGTKEQTVVCGAPNIAAGQRVSFAQVGARLTDPHSGEVVELKPAKIRGVVSEGMVCSEKELGISAAHEGIMVLAADAPIGIPLAQYLGDTVFDMKITPNRPDCQSVIGVAREVAAVSGQTVRLPDLGYQEPGPPIEELASVEVADPDLCPRYCASVITGVNIAPSPPWMQEQLTAAGMRPINNIVDITNYVMLEYGQPLHAFDYDNVVDHHIIVRRAREGETTFTIDGQERKLTADILVIADPQGAVAVAGIMGGLYSEVSDDTTNILLESANFNNIGIRRTSAGLKLRSEASIRFDKGLSPELTVLGLRRATQLMVELGGGKAARGIIDVYPGKKESEPPLLSQGRISQVLGVEVGRERTSEVLTSLGFSCQPVGESDLRVGVPYWRTDIRLADDLVEEVARIIGYDELPTTMLSSEFPRQLPAPILSLRQQVQDLLVGCGMQEVITYSLASRGMLERVLPEGKFGRALRLANPMTQEQEYLRTSLRSGLLSTFAANEKHQENSIRLFEVGKVYHAREGDLPEEREMLCAVLGGLRHDRSWFGEAGELDFFDAKGMVETVLARLGVSFAFEEAEDPILVPGRTARVVVAGEAVGVVGELHPATAAGFGISSSVVLFELDLHKLLSLTQGAGKYQPPPRFPAIRRDLAVVVDETVAASRVEETIRGSPLVSEVALFDVYRGEQVPRDKRSLAFSICYRSPSRTLTDEEVDRVQAKLVGELERWLGARLRS